MASGSGNPFIKSALRQVRDTLPRFLSILLIAVIGVAFFSGLRLTGPYMKYSADQWFDDRNFMDIQVYSTMGFDDDDIASLRSTSGVASVNPGYHTNVLINRNNNEVAALFVSIDAEGTGVGTAGLGVPMNTPEILSGRLPSSSDECLAEPSWFEGGRESLGDTVQVYSGTTDPLSDKLAISTFTIVGIARCPQFIAEDRGNSELGSGHNSYYFLVLPSAFTYEVYTTAYLQADFNGKTYSRFAAAYFDAVDPTVKALEQTGKARSTERLAKIKADGKKELDDARAEVADGYKELDDAKKELDDARIELEKSQVELDEGRAELDDGWALLAASREQLDDGWAKSKGSRPSLDNAWAELNDSRTQLDDNWAVLEASRGPLDDGWALLNEGRARLDEGWGEYYVNLKAFEDAQAAGILTPMQIEFFKRLLAAALLELENGEAEYEVYRLELEAGEAAYQDGLAELEAGEAAYQDGLAELEDAEAAYQSGLAELWAGEAAYQDGLMKLQDGEASYASGLEEFNKGKAEYEDGLATYEKERAEALVDLAQAEEDIAKGEKDLAALKAPKWYVLDLNSNPGFRSYKQESEQLEAIATVIPLLFFLIAALISMTSMTRLVDKDRTIIGTYKALGYTNGAITARYLVYALSASLIGGVIGVIVGYNLFPPLIFNAFHTMYSVPPSPALFSWPYAILSVAIALVSTVGPAALVSMQTLRETPAAAMRPLAPRPGKRILLERIKPLWYRLSFLPKVTARNLFRYKKRALMTLIGVAGCTGLMFTGFGLNDSLATVGPKQYGQIQRFDVAVTFKSDVEPNETERLFDFVNQSADISQYTLAHRETAEVVGQTQSRDLALIVPDDPGSFHDYYALNPSASKTAGPFSKPLQPYTLSDEGVILTDQISRQIGVTIGDTVTLRTLNNDEAQFVVVGIMENYVYHYAFITPAAYEQGFDKKPTTNQIFCLLAPESTGLPSTITDLPVVSGVTNTERSATSFSSITDVLGFVMAILILSAATLAFVVLFSLNTINREERARELASIKVLGFFNREIASYIYREGLVLTIFGVILGLAFGVVLERYIITTIEVDVFMFSRDLLIPSYLYSSLLTILFAIIVNLLIYRPLTNIDMVSSLKAVE